MKNIFQKMTKKELITTASKLHKEITEWKEDALKSEKMLKTETDNSDFWYKQSQKYKKEVQKLKTINEFLKKEWRIATIREEEAFNRLIEKDDDLPF